MSLFIYCLCILLEMIAMVAHNDDKKNSYKQEIEFCHVCIVIGVGKKIEAAGKAKGCEDLRLWKPSIVNHMYWCASSSDGKENYAFFLKT